MTIHRQTRDRRLTPEEAAKYREVRAAVEQELPELVSRHWEREEMLGDSTERPQQRPPTGGEE